jgi:phage N-6-adenine-methyltransferase
MSLQKAMVSSKSNEWETPQEFFNKLNQEFNFTLDPCSNRNHKCDKYFTIKEDGLRQDWSKDIVFMNPPYGGHTGDWIRKAYEESKRGAIVVCLIVSSSDRSYWHEYIFPYANQIRFIRGRLRFGVAKSTAPFASAIVIFGKRFKERIVYDKRLIEEN